MEFQGVKTLSYNLTASFQCIWQEPMPSQFELILYKKSCDVLHGITRPRNIRVNTVLFFLVLCQKKLKLNHLSCQCILDISVTDFKISASVLCCLSAKSNVSTQQIR
jgi:hypothetical protein